jgi:RecA/RadA recombinase
MANLGFLKDFKKTAEKLESVSVGISKPSHWYSTGNYGLNRVACGSYLRGLPESRIILFAGPSGGGKSFLASNLLKQAQDDGAFILVLDSENALDVEFLGKIGVDTSDESKFLKMDVGTIEDVNKIMSSFFKGYVEEHGKGKEGPRVVILLDSIAMLSTETETENYEKGVIKGDQGQRAKRTKAMMRMICSKIAQLPITVIATDHVYPQDIIQGDGKWAVTNSTKFAASIILICERLKLKENDQVVGVRMKVHSYKSRFTKIGNEVELEVPYDRGMSDTTGLWEILESDKVVTKSFGGWTFKDPVSGEETKFKESNINDKPELLQRILEVAAAKEVYADVKEDFVSEEAEFLDADDGEGMLAEEAGQTKKLSKKKKSSEEE